MILHILSTVIMQLPVQSAAVATGISVSLYAITTIRVMSAEANWPRPCMAKTAAMMPPRYRVLENSAVMTALNGSGMSSAVVC